MEHILKENSPQNNIEKLKKQKEEIIYKKDRLLELMIVGSINNEIYKEKTEFYSNKIEKIEQKIEQIELLIEDDKSIQNGLERFRNLFDNNDIIEVFDKEIFDALIDYVVIGGYDEDGVEDSFLVRFILKRQFKITDKNNISREYIVANNTLNNDKNLVILDFINNQTFKTFDRENDKIKRTIKNGLRVRLEYDIINENDLFPDSTLG